MHSQFFKAVLDVIAKCRLLALRIGDIGNFHALPYDFDHDITVEFPETLMNTIASTETGDLSFLVSELGRPFVKESLGNWFGARCREAGLNLNAHGLRKLSATLAANAGAAAHELMAQYGWTNLKQAETYTKKADRASLGIRSSRRVSDQIENEISRTRISGAGKIANNTDNSDS